MNLDLCAIFLFIQQLANIHNIKIIEDAACAFGIILAGKRPVHFVGCFNFHPEKFSPQEGGAIVTNDAK